MKLKDKLINIGAGYALMLVWVVIITKLLGFLYDPSSNIFSQFYFYKEPSIYFKVFMACIWAPLWEELVFRNAPLQLIRGSQTNPIHVIVITSALFGWLHGGPVNIMIQGVYGVVFSYVYLRNGYCYWSSVILHSLYNASLFFIKF